MVLNLTVTVPSWRLTLSQIANGKRPAVASLETCAKTCGLLGTDSSIRTSHLGAPPLCVMATVQPAGVAPGLTSSKLITFAEQTPVAESRIAMRGECFIPMWQHHSEPLRLGLPE